MNQATDHSRQFEQLGWTHVLEFQFSLVASELENGLNFGDWSYLRWSNSSHLNFCNNRLHMKQVHPASFRWLLALVEVCVPLCLMPSLHRRHRQHKTVFSCPCRRCELGPTLGRPVWLPCRRGSVMRCCPLSRFLRFSVVFTLYFTLVCLSWSDMSSGILVCVNCYINFKNYEVSFVFFRQISPHRRNCPCASERWRRRVAMYTSLVILNWIYYSLRLTVRIHRRLVVH